MDETVDRPARLLIVAAHPDDETIGAAALMTHAGEVRVLHLTDGAPKHATFRLLQTVSREDYAALRRREAIEALGHLGVCQPDIRCLDIADQEAALHIGDITKAVYDFVEAWRPTVVVTHAYEGGHPDHDAAAFATRAAVRLVERDGRAPPSLLEMALYHGLRGGFTIGRFLPGDGPPQIARLLTPTERSRKRAMLRCFATQREVWRPFYDLPFERYRSAPVYDFTKPPHEGTLLYERWGFPISGEDWRLRARRATADLRL
jgi:LmbE family N-acetylglucosaminyl deacetylase